MAKQSWDVIYARSPFFQLSFRLHCHSVDCAFQERSEVPFPTSCSSRGVLHEPLFYDFLSCFHYETLTCLPTELDRMAQETTNVKTVVQ